MRFEITNSINTNMFKYSQIIESPNILDNYKSRDKVPLVCEGCNKEYSLSKNRIQMAISSGHLKNYCSISCFGINKKTSVSVRCTNCDISFKKRPSAIKPNKNNFCSKSCSAIYNNKNKSYGIRRSKLEIWLENELQKLYPNLEIHFNRKDAIGSELDIYIPSLRLAFELNGIFHYEPIYGSEKLKNIQENDNNKFHQCREQKISLCIIDTSGQKYFKPQSSMKFLKIITDIINSS